ncbi:hypothetical protein [Burkholderia glumae]|uniref:hypothetical protein n=1 Tax=Burkholderia glumae TaxID=337 RepID=UPI00214FA539|nr:hypothetical protein [Burkholderia glumae]
MRRILMLLPAFIYARLVQQHGERFSALGANWNYDGRSILVRARTTTEDGK